MEHLRSVLRPSSGATVAPATCSPRLLLLSVVLALLLVDEFAKRERSLRYAELTWVLAQTAFDAMENIAGRIASASRL